MFTLYRIIKGLSTKLWLVLMLTGGIFVGIISKLPPSTKFHWTQHVDTQNQTWVSTDINRAHGTNPIKSPTIQQNPHARDLGFTRHNDHSRNSTARYDKNTNENATCEPKMYVAFIKVYKAGSTTVTTILQRFGYTRKLNFVLPDRAKSSYHVIIGLRPGSINENNILPHPVNQSYNILCNHVAYNREAFRRILHKDTVNIAIVRHPLQRFLSRFRYTEMNHILLRGKNISLVDKPAYLLKTIREPRYSDMLIPGQHSYWKNSMSVDLGINISRMDNQTEVERFVDSVFEDFRLVMILERFDESIILLRRIMCWKHEDVVYFKKNAQRSVDFKMDESALGDLRALNNADFVLYNRSVQYFDKLVELGGSDFLQEVQHFQTIRVRVKHVCDNFHLIGRKIASSASFDRIEPSKWDEGFHIRRDLCLLLEKSELDFLGMLHKAAKTRKIVINKVK